MANIIGSSLYAYPWVAPSPTITAGEYWFKEELDLTAAGGGLEQAIGFTTPNYDDALGAYVKITAGSDRITYNAELSSNDLAAYANGAWLVKDARLISVTADTIVSKEFYNWFTANTYTSPFDMTYTGNYNVREDGVVELLTSGTLVFLNPAVIDRFMVGGGGAGGRSTGNKNGGGGGGGGYTLTTKSLQVAANTPVEITIGAGGVQGSNISTHVQGGSTIWGSTTVNGGKGTLTADSTTTYAGADGGSGGGGGTISNSGGGVGGSDGNNGAKGGSSGSLYNGGTGQGITTREFGEQSGKMYAGGGGGGRYLVSATPVISMGGAGGGGSGAWVGDLSGASQAAASGVANTGGGGGGGATNPSFSMNMAGGNGGSGIVCFRDAAPLPELAGTWVLNERLYAPVSTLTFSGSFIWGTNPNCTAMEVNPTSYLYVTIAGTKYTKYQFSNNQWLEATRNVIFPAGATASDEFRAWLASNATKQ